MKKRAKKAISRKTSQFRYHKINTTSEKGKKKIIRHPTYIFVIIGNLFRYVSLTHSKEVEGEEVVKLRENPNKEDKRKSYRVIGYQEDTKDNFGKKITKWRINPLDDEDIRKDKKR